MAQIIWTTKSGELSSVAEGNYYEYQLEAYDTQGSALTFKVISGQLSSGLQMFKSGLIQGVPIVEKTSDDLIYVQTFTVRATNSQGKISDRTFSITINQIANPQIVPKNTSLGTFYDGYYLDIDLAAIEPSPTATLEWQQIAGTLPLGTTLTSDGKLSGYLQSYKSAESESVLGWSVTGWDSIQWDTPTAAAQSMTYQFTVRVYDGTRYDTSTYTIRVQAKSLYTVDNTEIDVNDTSLTVDTDNRHMPYIVTPPADLPAQRQNSNFAFQIVGDDLDGDELRYGLIVLGEAAFDQGATPSEPLMATSAFDYDGFDQEGQALPPGVSLDPVTGWITGFLESQAEEEKEYKFQVYCYKAENPDFSSRLVTFTLTVLGSRDNTVTWFTPSNLGEMNNGAISELVISAKSNLGKVLNYRITESTKRPPEIYSATQSYDGVITYTPQARSELPQGLKLLPSGLIVGRATFDFFKLDGGSTTIDKGTTNFDDLYEFSITASDEVDGLTAATISSTKTFQLRINNWNKTPYENIYLRALTSRTQRQAFANLMANEEIFPSEMLYRKDDPWFGKSTDVKFLFASGLTPSLAASYIGKMANNHYTKNINLGNVKTAVALDDNFDIKYEVVYIEVLDPLTEDGKSPAMSLDRTTQVKPPYDVLPFTVIHPNSLDNMKTEVSDIGYANKGALPKWMVDQQEDGRVLGFTRGVVLAYTKPGRSKLMAYRLSNVKANFNDVEFVADRYQLDNIMSKNFNISTKVFVPSYETTFDRLPPASDLHPYAGSVSFALTVPFDEINGRTIEYISQVGGIDGSTVVDGQLIIFAKQENFNAATLDDFAYTRDSFDSNIFDDLGYNLMTIPRQYSSPNEGWNIEEGSYGANPYAEGEYSGIPPYYDPDNSDGVDSEYYDDSRYSPASVVPGFLENLVDPSVINQRAGIWKVKVNNNLVTLEFVKEVKRNEYVLVAGGASYGGTKLYLDPIIKPGHTVPEYSVLSNKVATAGNATRFDGGATTFKNNRDEFSLPEEHDRFLKFPKQNVYR